MASAGHNSFKANSFPLNTDRLLILCTYLKISQNLHISLSGTYISIYIYIYGYATRKKHQGYYFSLPLRAWQTKPYSRNIDLSQEFLLSQTFMNLMAWLLTRWWRRRSPYSTPEYSLLSTGKANIGCYIIHQLCSCRIYPFHSWLPYWQ